MNKKVLKLAFLWHMHQPYYKDDISTKTKMPWVFLHAIKDYYDLPYYLSKYEDIKATFNLVPSLISQLDEYIRGVANDKFLNIVEKSVRILNEDEMKYVESYLFFSNEDNMIKPLDRYYELLNKYKENSDSISNFSYEEINDLETLFLLSWCGNYLRENSKVVKSLLQKGRDFSHEDKTALLQSLREFLKEILPFYKSLAQKNQITICTTPYYHPITPLLLDINSAVEARSDVVLPKVDADFSNFGVNNTKYSIEYFEKIFGFKPKGFWPAEGSVSLKSAKLFSSSGLEWFCTDEEILYKTIKRRDKKELYKNYYLELDGKRVDVRFRDRYLSDIIGFEYSKKDAKESAKEFVNHLREVYKLCDFSPLVNVILDGENAWEFFPNNAQEFFHELYLLLDAQDWIECVTMDDISTDSEISSVKLDYLTSGSWINGNFDIWIGSEEKNRAWELLDLTKKEYDKNLDNISIQNREKIEKEFMVALGSDWFWWYGDDHYTAQKSLFDRLFRKHLANIYSLMDIKIPNEIITPIIKDGCSNLFFRKPIEYISPKIDGKKSSYFEWLNAGRVDLKREFSVMDSTKKYLDVVKYGYNKDTIFFLFKGEIDELLNKNSTLLIELNSKKIYINLKEGREILLKSDVEVEVFCKNVIEMKVSRDYFNNKIDFKFSLFIDEKKVQPFPVYSDFIIELDDLDLVNWYV